MVGCYVGINLSRRIAVRSYQSDAVRIKKPLNMINLVVRQTYQNLDDNLAVNLRLGVRKSCYLNCSRLKVKRRYLPHQ